MRPDQDTWALSIAEAVSGRASCARRKVGAVIVAASGLIAPGYNEVPSRQAGCLDGGCPRGRHYEMGSDVMVCGCGNDWPCPEYVEPGSPYTGPGECRGIHAEINALLRSSWELNQEATMYVTCEPCDGCLRVIAGSGIRKVIWPKAELGPPFLKKQGPDLEEQVDDHDEFGYRGQFPALRDVLERYHRRFLWITVNAWKPAGLTPGRTSTTASRVRGCSLMRWAKGCMMIPRQGRGEVTAPHTCQLNSTTHPMPLGGSQSHTGRPSRSA